MTHAQAIDRVLAADDFEAKHRLLHVAIATPEALRRLALAKRQAANALEILASFAIDSTPNT